MLIGTAGPSLTVVFQLVDNSLPIPVAVSSRGAQPHEYERGHSASNKPCVRAREVIDGGTMARTVVLWWFLTGIFLCFGEFLRRFQLFPLQGGGMDSTSTSE